MLSRLAGAYAMDPEQSDTLASPSGIRGGLLIWARGVGQSYRSGAHRGVHRAGRIGWVPRPEEEDGYAGWCATGHFGRPHDRECVLHVFRRSGNGVALAADFIFRARRSNGLLAWAGDEIGTFRVGRKRHAADLVGEGSGGIALEPGAIRGNEMSVLLLLGIGACFDSRTCRAHREFGGGCAHSNSRRCAYFDMDDGGVLPGARATRSDRRMEIHRGKRWASARGKKRRAGGPVRGPRAAEKVNEVDEVKETSKGVAAFFDLDGTLIPLPSLERRLFRTLRYRRQIPARNYFLWLREAVRLLPRGVSASFQANKMYLRGVQISDERDEGDANVSSRHKGGHQGEGQ